MSGSIKLKVTYGSNIRLKREGSELEISEEIWNLLMVTSSMISQETIILHGVSRRKEIGFLGR